MFKTILFVALIQGLFLLFVLVRTKAKYQKPGFWLLVGSICSILLYILIDNSQGLFSKPLNMFYLDESLFVTFLFLFVKYYTSKTTKFNKKDLLYFIPNILYFLIEAYEMTYYHEPFYIEYPELLLEVTFFSYLVYTIFLLIKKKKSPWILMFAISLALLINLDIVNDFLHWFHLPNVNLFNDQTTNSYVLVLIAFLFYGLTLKLILEPKTLLSFNEQPKYKNSGLDTTQIETYKSQLINLMEQGKAFKDAGLSIQKVSDELNIPRQYISEILNIHMCTTFQDFVNSYRVEEFIHLLQRESHSNYTLFGIANEVGFNSKTTFNATFKKIMGVTPSEFKKNKKS